ncbi:hypothetical protein SAMN06272781_1883 [Streptomyces sp. 1222.2]|nr:hypothetical protein SAMN06272781_1883 [Streptomyces sp. 1222.2]
MVRRTAWAWVLRPVGLDGGYVDARGHMVSGEVGAVVTAGRPAVYALLVRGLAA